MTVCKYFCGLFLLAACSLSTGNAMAKSHQLSAQLWQHRIVITSANTEEELTQLSEHIATIWLDIKERKLLVLAIMDKRIYQLQPDVSDSTQNPEEAIKRLSGRHTLLIGLDGGSKMVYERFDSKQIFADIDAMPMRRSRNKQN